MPGLSRIADMMSCLLYCTCVEMLWIKEVSPHVAPQQKSALSTRSPLPRRPDYEDESDRLIELRGDWIGGCLLGTGIFATLFLTLAEHRYFWMALALLVVMVGAGVVENVAKLLYYHVGV